MAGTIFFANNPSPTSNRHHSFFDGTLCHRMSPKTMPLAHFGPLVATGVCIDPSARAPIGHHFDAKMQKGAFSPMDIARWPCRIYPGFIFFVCGDNRCSFQRTEGVSGSSIAQSFHQKKSHLEIVDFRVGSKKSSEKMQKKSGPTFLQIFQDSP